MDKVLSTNKTVINVANSYKMLSVWWMGIASTLAGIWLSMPVTMQDAVLAHLPVPAWALPAVSFALGYYFRVKAQKNLSGAVAEAKSADTPQDPVVVPAAVEAVVEAVSPQPAKEAT